MPTVEETALLERAARGDSDAFGRLIAPHRETLVRFARRQLAERAHLGEDAVQEALVNAHRALAGGARPENLRAWLFTIVRNCAININRAQRTAEPLPAAYASTSPDTVSLIEQREWMDGLMAAISVLPDRQREVLLGHTFEGRSYRELAERHSTTVSAVKTLLHRARRGLGSGSWVAALLPPWGWATSGIYRLAANDKLADRAGIKLTSLNAVGQMLGAATIASTVLLAIPGTQPGRAGATTTHARHAHMHVRSDTGGPHARHGGARILTPAVVHREAHQAITSCEHDKRVLRGTAPALHYAIEHLSTIVREYTECEYRIRRVLTESQVKRRFGSHRQGSHTRRFRSQRHH
ncbi:MAG: RNA polymerase sigma factor [Solirubrobacteraceae bacterium]